MRKRWWIALAALVLALSLIAVFARPSEKSELLLYLVGGDMESDSGSATGDLQELLRASRNYPKQSCTAYLCGSARWALPGLEDGNSYLIRIAGGEYRVLRDYGGEPGSAEERLGELLRCAARRADLILWGHGLSGARGVGDEQNALSLYELHAALKSSRARLRVIGFDACRMATLQAAWAVGPYCELFCAATGDVDLNGWPYLSVFPTLMQRRLTAEELRGAFRSGEMSVFSPRVLIRAESALCRVLDGSGRGDGVMLSELLRGCADAGAADRVRKALGGGELALTQWDADELPTEELLPGIAESYRAFLKRR